MEVSVNTTIRVDVSLAVGELEESVIVTGEAPMLQTDRTNTGRIIERIGRFEHKIGMRIRDWGLEVLMADP